jgi:hypothetical protein
MLLFQKKNNYEKTVEKTPSGHAYLGLTVLSENKINKKYKLKKTEDLHHSGHAHLLRC